MKLGVVFMMIILVFALVGCGSQTMLEDSESSDSPRTEVALPPSEGGTSSSADEIESLEQEISEIDSFDDEFDLEELESLEDDLFI